jgi:peptidoglycan/LPS O-acetylase OafA/YrhL
MRATISNQKLIGLEYFRGFAAVGVASCHYLDRLYGSELLELLAVSFVEAFFPLSGFVLGRQVSLVAVNPSQYPIFLARRWLRTLPAYFVALFTMSILTASLSIYELVEYGIFIKYLDPTGVVNDFFPIAWSLAIEEWYYLGAPLVFILVGRILGIKIFGSTLVILIMLAMIKALLLSAEMTDHYRTLTWVRLDAILIGYLFFQWCERANTGAPFIGTILITVGSVIFLLFENDYRQMSGVLMVTLLSLLSIGFAALVSIIYRWEKKVSKPRNNAWSFLGTWMGRVSYNIYLFHLVFLLVLERIGEINAVAYFALLAIFGVLFYKFFEAPILAARPRY